MGIKIPRNSRAFSIVKQPVKQVGDCPIFSQVPYHTAEAARAFAMLRSISPLKEVLVLHSSQNSQTPQGIWLFFYIA